MNETTKSIRVRPEPLWLEEVIKMLEAEDPNTPMPVGFGFPCSYRGYYEQLAFQVEYDTTVGDMLADARSALGATFQGYKGGSYRMGPHSSVWLVEDYSDCGEQLGTLTLSLMLAHGKAAGGDDRD